MRRQTKSFQRIKISNRKNTPKKPPQRLLILLISTFFVGFLLGFLIGTKQEKEITFILPETSPAISDALENAPEKVLPENLPWNLTLVNFEYPLDENFKPAELADIDNGYTFFIESQHFGLMLERGKFRVGHKKSELITKKEHAIHINGFSGGLDIVGKAVTKEQLIKKGK